MPKIHVRSRSGDEHEIEYNAETSLRQAIIDGGVEEILAMTSCGGFGSCGTCQVFVDPAYFNRLAAMDPNEDALLDISPHRKTNSRLSCQIELTEDLDGLRVEIAPEL